MSDERLRINEKEYENDINCKDCYEMNKRFLGVSAIPIILDRYIQQGTALNIHIGFEA